MLINVFQNFYHLHKIVNMRWWLTMIYETYFLTFNLEWSCRSSICCQLWQFRSSKLFFKNLSQRASIILTRDKCYSRKIIVFFPKLEILLQLEHLTSDRQWLWFFYIVLKYCLISCNIDNLLALYVFINDRAYIILIPLQIARKVKQPKVTLLFVIRTEMSYEYLLQWAVQEKQSFIENQRQLY